MTRAERLNCDRIARVGALWMQLGVDPGASGTRPLNVSQQPRQQHNGFRSCNERLRFVDRNEVSAAVEELREWTYPKIKSPHTPGRTKPSSQPRTVAFPLVGRIVTEMS
jgi:hypothetical protein